MAKVLILAAGLALAGCQTTAGTFCQVSSPIRLSAEAVDALADPEVTALLAHNEKGAKLCGWKP